MQTLLFGTFATAATTLFVLGFSSKSLFSPHIYNKDKKSSRSRVAPEKRALFLNVLRELVDAAERALEDSLPTVLTEQRQALAAMASRGGGTQRGLPPIDKTWESCVAAEAESILSRLQISDEECFELVSTLQYDPEVKSLLEKIVSFAPTAGIDIKKVLQAIRIASARECELWKSSALAAKKNSLTPGTIPFSRSVRSIWSTKRVEPQEIPAPFNKSVSASIPALPPASAAVCALGKPWTPPRAMLWQDIALSMQSRDTFSEIARESALAQRNEERLLRKLGIVEIETEQNPQ